MSDKTQVDMLAKMYAEKQPTHVEVHIAEAWSVVEAVKLVKAAARTEKLEAQVGVVKVMLDIETLGTDEHLSERWQRLKDELRERGIQFVVS